MIVTLEGRILGGKYRLTRELAVGGNGVVYEAEHLALGSAIVLKVPHPGVRLTPEGVERFRREAEAAAQLRSSYVVRVFDRGEEPDGLLWIAMERLEGETLEARLARDGRMPPRETVALLVPLCRALHEAHERGIVHRDLKPENIMLVPSSGELVPKLFDFGIAALQRDLHLTDPNLIGGTPHYMAPEQWEGLAMADARSDLYSLAVIAYRCLSGRLPYEATSAYALMNAQRYHTPRDLADGGDLPSLLCAAVMNALDRDPDRRPQSALVLAESLERGLVEPAPPASITPAPVSVNPPAPPAIARRARWPMLVAAAVLLVAGAWNTLRPRAEERAGRCSEQHFMPLEVGRWWRYRVTDPATGRPDPTDKTITIDRYGDVGGTKAGVMAFRVARSDASGTAFRWLKDTGSGVVWVMDEWFEPSGERSRTRVYQPHRLRIDESCERTRVGATWIEEFDTITIDYPPKGGPQIEHSEEEWTVEADDDVVHVRAGEFHCLRVHRVDVAAHIDSRYWYALDVGKVMEDSPPKEHEELVAWGRDWPSDAGP